MKFLVDTNTFLEVILGQERSDEVKIFLSTNFDADFDRTDKGRKTPAEIIR